MLGNIAAETDAFGSARIPGYAAQAVNSLSAPANRAALRATWEHGVRRAARGGRAGQRPPAHLRALLRRAPRTPTQALDDLEGLLDGDARRSTGLAVDTDLRWSLLAGLARAGRADDERIAEELRRDNTISGQERAAAARAARPTAEAKAEAWEVAMVRDDVPNETQRSVVLAFMQQGQDERPAALRREVLRRGRHAVGGEGHPARLDRAGVHLPAPAGLPRAARPGRAWLERVPGQARGQALRARGRRRRRALPGRPGEGRHGLSFAGDSFTGSPVILACVATCAAPVHGPPVNPAAA